MNLSIVIPAYNESDNIKDTVAEFFAVTGKIKKIDKVEVIVVDDHSADNTYDKVVELGNPMVKCVRLSRNSGSHVAIRAGLKEAAGDAVLCISADGQDDPSCIEKMLEKWSKGAYTIWALRKSRKGEPWYISKPSKLFYKLLIWLGGADGANIDISRATFFLLDGTVAKAINNCSERNTSIFGLIAWLGFSQDIVEYEQRARKFGKSKWSFAKRLHLAGDWIIGFSGLPLSLIFLGGLIVAMLAILYAFYIIMNIFMGKPIQGWAIVLEAILLLSGVQMIMMGIIGEYLWRNLDESRKRPIFFVEKKSGR